MDPRRVGSGAQSEDVRPLLWRRSVESWPTDVLSSDLDGGPSVPRGRPDPPVYPVSDSSPRRRIGREHRKGRSSEGHTPFGGTPSRPTPTRVSRPRGRLIGTHTRRRRGRPDLRTDSRRSLTRRLETQGSSLRLRISDLNLTSLPGTPFVPTNSQYPLTPLSTRWDFKGPVSSPSVP